MITKTLMIVLLLSFRGSDALRKKKQLEDTSDDSDYISKDRAQFDRYAHEEEVVVSSVQEHQDPLDLRLLRSLL